MKRAMRVGPLKQEHESGGWFRVKTKRNLQIHETLG